MSDRRTSPLKCGRSHADVSSDDPLILMTWCESAPCIGRQPGARTCMLTTNEVLCAFDAVGDASMHNQVLMQRLAADGHDPGEIASAIEAAISAGQLALTTAGFIRRPPACVVQFRLTIGEQKYVANGHSDGSWLVAEDNGRVLAAPGATNPRPMKVVAHRQSGSPEKIAGDLAEWARGHFGPDVIIEPN